MVTADLALARGVPVLAVPGSVRSSASVGTNRLLAEGATPVCDSSDILTALSLQPPDPRAAAAQRPPPPTGLQLVLDAVDWFPTSPNVILDRTGLAPPEAAAALAQLERSGWVRWQGGWWERAP
jgi:DNA processing protein